MRKVAKKVCKLSLFSQLSAPIKSGVKIFFQIILASFVPGLSTSSGGIDCAFGAKSTT